MSADDVATVVLPPPAPRDDLPAIWDLVKADIAAGAADPVDALLVADIDARDAFGAAKYGVRLKARDGRSPIIDAYQEALDQIAYLRKDIEEQPLGSFELPASQYLYGLALHSARVLRATIQRRGGR